MNNHHYPHAPEPGPACEQFAPLLALVGQERLDPRDNSSLRQHLATCDYCQNELDGYTHLDDLLARHFGAAPRGPLSPADIRALTSRDYRPRTAPDTNNGHHTRRSAPPAHPTSPQPAVRGRRVISILSAIAAVLIIAAVSVALFASHPAPGNGKQTKTTPANLYIPQQDDTLDSIFMLSASEGWAVGLTSNSVRTSQNLMLHYRGGHWERVSDLTNQDLHTTIAGLDGIIMLSASDGWAIGNFLPANSQTMVGAFFHYNGAHWSLQQTITYGFLASFSMTSPTDGWAVGNYAKSGTQVAQSLLLHYDGKTWTRVQAPGQQMTTIAMTSASDGWATGITRGNGNGFPGSIVLHYNGTRWASSAILNINTVNALSLHSASDGWAVGVQDFQNGTWKNIFAHYDGKTWTAVQTPITNNDNATITGLFMDSADDGWAVGTLLSGAVNNPTSSPLYLHYSGGHWTEARGPAGAAPYSVFMLSASEGWAVGDNGTIIHYQNGAWHVTTSAFSPLSTPTPTYPPVSPVATPCDTITGPTIPPPYPGTPVPTIPLTTWTVYNANGLFTINEPNGWRSDDASCNVGHLDVIFTNYDSSQFTDSSLPPGTIKIELTLSEAPQSGSALDFWQQIQQADQQAGPTCPSFTTRQLQVAGRAAVEGGCPALNWDSFIIPDGKNMLDITESAANGIAPSDILTQMVNTLTFPT
jgi:hypothetical protein